MQAAPSVGQLTMARASKPQCSYKLSFIRLEVDWNIYFLTSEVVKKDNLTSFHGELFIALCGSTDLIVGSYCV